jgi:hypothetical protein
MSSRNPPPDRQKQSRGTPRPRDPAAAGAALVQAAQAWTSLVDDWWRQQSAALPPELERAMSATLDQSKALVDMAFAQTARAVTESAAPTRGAPPEESSAADEFGLWQPVIDACRACESSLLGNGGGSDSPRSGPAGDYQRAASAYLNEFVQINREVAQRLQQRLAASPPADFRQLHALVVEEAENAYLDRVSTDRFAALQAAYINAMFRLRKEMAGAASAEKP